MEIDKEKNLTLLLRICLILSAVEWAVFAILNLFQSTDLIRSNPSGIWMALLMIGNAVLFGLGAWLVEKSIVQIFFIIWLLINFILTFTDDFGLFDMLNSILVGFTLFLLIIKIQSHRKKQKES